MVQIIEGNDSKNPVINPSLLPDITRNTDTGKATANVEWTSPTASDNSLMVTLTRTHTSPFDFPIGVTMVIYTATDPASNTATTSFRVTVTGKHQ